VPVSRDSEGRLWSPQRIRPPTVRVLDRLFYTATFVATDSATPVAMKRASSAAQSPLEVHFVPQNRVV
jgi:hypothetical protein